MALELQSMCAMQVPTSWLCAGNVTVACDSRDIVPALVLTLIAAAMMCIVVYPCWGVWQWCRRSERRNTAANQCAAADGVSGVRDSSAANESAVLGMPTAAVAEKAAPAAASSATRHSV